MASLHQLAVLSNTDSTLALFEKRTQLRQVILASLQGDGVDIIPAKDARKFVVPLLDKSAETRSRVAVGRVDFNLIASLGILKSNNAYVWQHLLALIMNMDRYEIMPPSADR